jgi:uncharacterized membrane protein
MNNGNIRKLIYTALMTAMVFVVTYAIKITLPGTTGFYNIGDSMIMITAVIFGARSAFFAGAVGSVFADFSLGFFPIYGPYTFIIKGLEGLIIGILINKNNKRSTLSYIIYFTIGAIIMVAGYFISEAFIINNFFKGYGTVTAIANLPFNAIQGALSIIAATLLSAAMDKNKLG